MTYKEPAVIFKNSFSCFEKNNKISLSDSTSLKTEISFLENIGWEIEVRYDLIHPTFIRQPKTGVQDTIPLSSIEKTIGKEGHILLSVNDQKLTIQDQLKFSLHVDGSLVFNTSSQPFSYHKDSVQIYEKLMSLKVTDFSERAPFAPKGTMYDTHMVRFQYPLPEGAILGIPGQTGEYNRKGYRYELFNTDNYLHIPTRDPLYQSWPIILHKGIEGKWIAIFHDNPSRTFIDLGEFYEDKVTFESLIGNTRVYIIVGDTLSDVSHKLSLLLGRNLFPPLWSFGYQQCRFSYMNTDEMNVVVKSLEKNDIPVDALYCDIDSMDGFRVFTNHPKSFKDLPDTIEKFKKKNIQTVSIVDPGVKIDPEFTIYTELKNNKGYLTNKDGSEFKASVWPGKSLYPDFTNEKIINWWADKEKNWLNKFGFAGIWNDMNEPSNFDRMTTSNSTAFSSIAPLKNIYNLYGYFMTIASKKGWEKQNPDKRGLIITRSGYPGVQRNAIIWHGDNYAWWEHLKLALQTAVTYSLCGAYFTGADIPGFSGNAPEDLAVRFFQLGSWLPFFRGHSIFFAKDSEPYVYSEHAKSLIREAIHLRYSLMREWYSGFELAIRTQQAPLKPVFSSSGSLINDEFTLFNKFLVAPVIERDQVKKIIYLPEGDWYSLGNPKDIVKGNQWLMVDITPKSIPVYVKAGSIITRNKVGKTTKETFNKTELFEVYQDIKGKAEGYWFNDDGWSIDDTKAERFELTYRNGKVEKNPYLRKNRKNNAASSYINDSAN